MHANINYAFVTSTVINHRHCQMKEGHFVLPPEALYETLAFYYIVLSE